MISKLNILNLSRCKKLKRINKVSRSYYNRGLYTERNNVYNFLRLYNKCCTQTEIHCLLTYKGGSWYDNSKNTKNNTITYIN
jgi:hypothetical protein